LKNKIVAKKGDGRHEKKLQRGHEIQEEFRPGVVPKSSEKVLLVGEGRFPQRAFL
jgi:hypothetical protein